MVRFKFRSSIIAIFCLSPTFLTIFLYVNQCLMYEYVDDKTACSICAKERELWLKHLKDEKGRLYEYGPLSPLIFIGGFPRSGTTLMRAMLDAHPDVRCGEETRVVPRILGMRNQWMKSAKERERLLGAGISEKVLDNAIMTFLLEIIVKHGLPAKRFCNKDPFALKSTDYLAHLFPNAKFILMLRDGRATVHSMIKRKVTVTGFDLTNFRECLKKWNDAVSHMYQLCYTVGSERCLPVYYEQLVLEPRKWLQEVAKFLQLPWNEFMLHHEKFIGQEIKLSKNEKSSDQVVKAIYKGALTDWVGHIPDDVVKDMASVAPMLDLLGYDPYANPPDYARPYSRPNKELLSTYSNGPLSNNGLRATNLHNLSTNR